MRANGHTVIIGAIGGSTISDAAARVTTDAELIRKCQKFFYWDGRQNGLTTVPAYADILAGMLATARIDYVIVPCVAPFATIDPAQEVAVRDEFVSRWPTKTYDWRNNIANTGGIVNQNRMLNYPTDTDHLNQTAHTEAYTGYSALL